MQPTSSPTQTLAPNALGDTQHDAPFSEALQALAGTGWQRLHVPGHQAQPQRSPALVAVLGEPALALDFPMLFSQIDQETWVRGGPRPSPLIRSQRLAAEAWGAERAWFLTNGASMGNHIAALAARTLGPSIVMQRSMHSSAIHGMILAGLEPHFVQPAVDRVYGSAHGVTAAQIEEALRATPDAGAAYVISPSYFGAVADVRAIADVCHAHGVPLIVDESWGSHFGFHPELPLNAIRAGADLVISSSHKSIGSLTQSAMLFQGTGPFAARLGMAVDRVYPTLQSTSSSALLMLSLDEARRRMATDDAGMDATLADLRALRAAVAAEGRFPDAGPRMLQSPDVIALDPLKVVLDMRSGGIDGALAQHLLIRDHEVHVEMSTPAVIVALVGAQTRVDVDRFVRAIHALPEDQADGADARLLPEVGPRRVALRDAYFAEAELVPAAEAVGRVSADALAAYPPGIPNVLPGEELTAEIVDFLRATAASAAGHVRGAAVADLAQFRVLAR